jgi:hypothetical protein
MRTIQRVFRVHRSQIAYIKFIFEAYEGIASLSTIDADAGLISVNIAPGCEQAVADLMTELRKTILVAPMDKDDLRDVVP